MKTLLGLFGLGIGLLVLAGYCESKKDPYEEGMHMDYSIQCENGFNKIQQTLYYE